MSYSENSPYPLWVGHAYPYSRSEKRPILGYYEDCGFTIPIQAPDSPEYTARLAEMRETSKSAWSRAMDNISADDLDRKCTEMHEYNTSYRARHGL